MSRTLGSAVLFGGLCLGVAVAADPIKLELKDFKWKCKFDSGDTLGGFEEGEGKLFFYTFGTQTATVKIPEDGEYTITVEASCNPAEKEMAKFKLTVGDVEVAKEHSLTQEEAKSYELTAKLKKGEAKLVIEFLNDKFKEGEYDLNLYIHGVKIEQKKAGAEKKEEKKVEEKKAVIK
jgi:Ca-dependent carbohydrate-binding module xylan-binding